MIAVDSQSVVDSQSDTPRITRDHGPEGRLGAVAPAQNTHAPPGKTAGTAHAGLTRPRYELPAGQRYRP